MRLLLKTVFAVLLLTFSICAQDSSNAQTNSSSRTTANSNAITATKEKKRGPVFRASKDQVMQAQKMLKEKGMYAGEETGKLNDDMRAALKKYQEAENLKVTGTLNRVTLEKMNIALTDKQRTM